ncbi:MAG: NAD-dependent epimerase/dehydratase family protein, partial [Patescibacteria group bacterium]
MRIILTGASGYLGSQLIDLWLKDSRIQEVIAIDLKDPRFLFHKDSPKVRFIQKNIADIDFEREIENPGSIDAVVHAAYFIRTPYFNRNKHIRSNIFGAENIFKFTLNNRIRKLIHFSTVAIYGAKKENSLDVPFKESDPIKEDRIAYGKDKGEIEKILQSLNQKYQNQSETEISVLRIGSVAGPFGKFVIGKKGLQSFFRGALPILPVTGNSSARQFVHEDDIVGAVNFCLFENLENRYSIFNLAPNGFMTFREIARTFNKKVLKLPKFFLQIFFWLTWHLSLGHIPTPPFVVNSYAY